MTKEAKWSTGFLAVGTYYITLRLSYLRLEHRDSYVTATSKNIVKSEPKIIFYRWQHQQVIQTHVNKLR